MLVVDDCCVALERTRQWLVAAGYRVSTREAAVGTAAAVVALHPDVMLLDVLMPGIRGDDLARLLKRNPRTRGVPIILISSLRAEELGPLIMTTGALGVIGKTPSQAAFTAAFDTLSARLRPAVSTSGEIDLHAGSSGTYPVEGFAGSAEVDVGKRRR